MKRRRWGSSVFSRLVERDGDLCGICKKVLEGAVYSLDHRLPLSRGGKDSVENLQLAHYACNNRKGSLTQEEYDKIVKKILKRKLKEWRELALSRADFPNWML